jgi:hypothetical protein
MDSDSGGEGEILSDGVEPEPNIWLRLGSAAMLALVMGLGAYALAMSTRGGAVVTFSFLLLLPAAICAVVCLLMDPYGRRSLGAYMAVPFWILLGVIVISVIPLKEGIVCILMLAPLWLGSGLGGAYLTYALSRGGGGYGRTHCAALVALPFIAMQMEPLLPVPEAEANVSRSIIVAAPPEAIWPLLEGIGDVRADEGRWTISQNLIGIPRPKGARLVGEGIGAERHAQWAHGVRFRERITQWRRNERIGWVFDFRGSDGWDFTDRHLRPDSAYFRILSGGYSVERLDGGRSRVTLDTRYWMKTPVNGYSTLWGELFLGDLENNLLALIQKRAEGQVRPI